MLGVFAAARDVTAQKQASQYARSLIEASLDPLVTISADGKITDVNEASVKVTGVTRERLIGTDFSDYFTEPTKRRKATSRSSRRVPWPTTRSPSATRNGNLTDVLYNASVYKDDKDNVLGVFAAARDVTAQKQASQYARSLIEASLDPLVTISAEGKITDVNEASVKVTGRNARKADRHRLLRLLHRAREGAGRLPAGLREGLRRRLPAHHPPRDGSLTDVLYNASVYKDDSGNVLGVFAAARDVTAQKQASQYARSLIEASPRPARHHQPRRKDHRRQRGLGQGHGRGAREADRHRLLRLLHRGRQSAGGLPAGLRERLRHRLSADDPPHAAAD